MKANNYLFEVNYSRRACSNGYWMNLHLIYAVTIINHKLLRYEYINMYIIYIIYSTNYQNYFLTINKF